MSHPITYGTPVRHSSQQWARAATATIVGSDGPYTDGSYEYLVRTGKDFSRPLGPDNPPVRFTWWSGLATIVAERTER